MEKQMRMGMILLCIIGGFGSVAFVVVVDRLITAMIVMKKRKKGLLQSISMHCKAFYLMKLVKNTLIQALLNCLNSVQEMQIQNSFANVSIVTFMITGKNM